MEQFITNHSGLVAIILTGLFATVVALGKREFVLIQRHQDRQDARLDYMAKELTRLDKELVDSKQDRRGLHRDVDQQFKTVDDKLDLIQKSNQDAHEAIIRLIRSNGR